MKIRDEVCGLSFPIHKHFGCTISPHRSGTRGILEVTSLRDGRISDLQAFWEHVSISPARIQQSASARAGCSGRAAPAPGEAPHFPFRVPKSPSDIKESNPTISSRWSQSRGGSLGGAAAPAAAGHLPQNSRASAALGGQTAAPTSLFSQVISWINSRVSTNKNGG